jgi:hypothetical protein
MTFAKEYQARQFTDDERMIEIHNLLFDSYSLSDNPDLHAQLSAGIEEWDFDRLKIIAFGVCKFLNRSRQPEAHQICFKLEVLCGKVKYTRESRGRVAKIPASVNRCELNKYLLIIETEVFPTTSDFSYARQLVTELRGMTDLVNMKVTAGYLLRSLCNWRGSQSKLVKKEFRRMFLLKIEKKQPCS